MRGTDALGLAITLGATFMAAAAPARAELAVDVLYLERQFERPSTLSELPDVPEDLGLAGARLGLADDATTGGFMGHAYALEEVVVPPGDDWPAAARAALADGPRIVVANAPAADLLALADLPEAAGALIFNVAAEDTALREADCRANVLHTIASHDMRADALMQFLVWKRWDDLALVSGAYPADRAFADALRGSAAKFGLEIAAEREWVFDADIRRSAATEVPVFTQELGAYDVLLVADETDDFARFVLYNTWEPRLVAGSMGLSPRDWSAALENWGASELQQRFAALAGRDMRSVDYAAWLALRTVGEAVTRTGAADPAGLRAYVLSEAFRLDGFKGASLSYRDWNGQLRAPIPLVHPEAMVTLAPLEGFLHERNPLDTLGIEGAQSACGAFR